MLSVQHCILKFSPKGLIFLSRLSLAFKSFFALLFSGKLPDQVVTELGLMRRVMTTPPPAASSKPAPPPPSADPNDGAVALLALLQREARLVDFLMEDIAAYDDAQVGAAVRAVHEGSRKAVERHFELTPVVDGVEGAVTTLKAAGLKASDAARLKLLGNVSAEGNVESGILQHRGWLAKKADIPKAAKGAERIIAPAEIEVE